MPDAAHGAPTDATWHRPLIRLGKGLVACVASGGDAVAIHERDLAMDATRRLS